MATFTAPNGTVDAGDAIIASEHNANWTYLKNWLEGNAQQSATYPGVVQSTGSGSITGGLAVSGALSGGSFTSAGTVSLGSSDALYLNTSQHNVIGLSTGTAINGEAAGQFLKLSLIHI